MRPRKLTLKNFMPFRSSDGHTHEVDFSNLDLFAITGPMASGKSALIDAIVWCLYGSTARYTLDTKGVISTGESACEVDLDFTIGDRWFRAVRRTGKTTESGLSELEGGEWIEEDPSGGGAERLTKQIETLLGLDFDSFTKTVILPQGRYAEFLLSEPKKRRDLLANILELGVYARVADRAKEVAGQAKTRADTIRETLAQYAGVSREQVEQRRQEWETLRDQLTEVGKQEAVLQGLMEKAEIVAATLSRITDLRTEEHTRLEEKELARQKRDEAEARVLALTQDLAQTTGEREARAYDPGRHEVIRRAVTHMREHQAACQEAERTRQDFALAQQELEELAGKLADQEQHVTATHRAHRERAATLQADIVSGGDITWLTEKLSEAKHWKEIQQRQAQQAEQKKTTEEKLVRVRNSLNTLTQQEEAKQKELHDLTQQREQAREDEHNKGLLITEAERLAKELQDAAREEKQAGQEAEEARTALQAIEQKTKEVKDTLARAEQEERTEVEVLEEHRRRHAVEHLRQSLRISAPCPVCLTPTQKLPPTSEEDLVDLASLQQAANAAKETLVQVQKAWQEVDTALAVARTKKDTAEHNLTEREQKRCEAQEKFITRFPGLPSLAAAVDALRAQRQALTKTLKNLEGKAKDTDQERQALSRQREETQREEATLIETLRNLTENLTSGEKQLTVLARSLAPYLSDGNDPEAVLTACREALLQTQQEVKALEKTYREAEEALGFLQNQKTQKEGDLRVLTLEQKTALREAQRKAQAVRESLDIAAGSSLPDLSLLEGELLTLSQKKEQHDALLQREDTLRRELEQAEKQAVGLRADLQARERVLNETRRKLSQAAQDLEQARAELRADVVQSGLLGIGADGEGLQERLAAVHEHIIALRERRGRLEAEIAEQERRCSEKEQEETKLRAAETEGRLATDLHKLLGAEFTDFLSQGAVEALMCDATVHLQRLTHGRYSFDIAYKRRAIELQIVDHEDHRRTRPTHSLSGGETFLASLAIALALSQGFREVAAGKAAKTSAECLILDEGFGTLDREGLQLVAETLQELRGEEGRMVGIITHVEEVAAAMPMRIEVRKGSRTSTITVSG